MAAGSTLGVMTSLALAGAAMGQSLNVDFSTGIHSEGFGVPSPSFGGAANQPGFWTEFSTDVDGPVAAIGLDGEASGVSMFLQAPTTVLSLNDPGTTGDVEALLDDSIFGFGDVVGTVTLSGLANGDYRVIVYGFAGGQPQEQTLFMIGQESGLSGGAWTGSFQAGVTHVDLIVEVTDSTMIIEAVGGIWGQAGYLNGFQLTYLDGCSIDFTGDGLLDNGDIAAFVQAFLAGDPSADLSGDGILDTGDITAFVQAFLAGC
ncbi:MAG: GC-type dockerin domain-anchored protein [Phycisphaerales bacterium JB040]